MANQSCTGSSIYPASNMPDTDKPLSWVNFNASDATSLTGIRGAMNNCCSPNEVTQAPDDCVLWCLVPEAEYNITLTGKDFFACLTDTFDGVQAMMYEATIHSNTTTTNGTSTDDGNSTSSGGQSGDSGENSGDNDTSAAALIRPSWLGIGMTALMLGSLFTL
ncbi:hypothetical protein F5Y15DRAFT_414094 [Xylariaceae sp. FL0016]|nr:hypothetical protein F5Y15DRAFT_414094 [Xylariaceae sp. FL0016]